MKSALLLTLIGAFCLDSAPRYSQGAEHAADKSPTNVWTALVESEVNPRGGAGLVWHSKLRRFVLFGGLVSPEFTGKSGYSHSTYRKSIDVSAAC